MIRIRQIKVDNNNMAHLKHKCASLLRVFDDDITSLTVVKQSIDARKKPLVFYVYEVDVKVNNEASVLAKTNNKDIFKTPDEHYNFKITGLKVLKDRPVIVGAGPAGLFAAYLLAENGYKPIIIERGKKIEDRLEDVNKYWETGVLNTESNVQFGEGGAGTFSDGKLNTLKADKEYRGKKVFDTFVECGAPKDILVSNKPHIGTDLLSKVVVNMRNKIITMGGEFRYSTCLTGINYDNSITSIDTNKGNIKCECLILAIGHSSRDTIKMLYHQLLMEAKSFAVGIRIQHPQQMVNDEQYGFDAHKGSATYKLTHTASDGRGVYTFCMCPGGYVVNSWSEDGMICTNGMSNYKRDSKNANSAVIVTVSPKDFGTSPLDGIEFQRKLEANAYKIGKGLIPIQLFDDYLNNRPSTSLGKVEPVIKGGYTLTDLNPIFPDYINKDLKEGILAMNHRLRGFSRDDAIIAGVEARTSSPVRIIRDDNGEANIKGIYPIGEGAGYAGGITSAAMDGVKVAEEVAKIYKRF